MRIIIGKESCCHYASIQEGINYLEKLPENEDKEIRILPGEYIENVELRLSNVEMIGVGDVKIIGSKYARQIHKDGNETGTARSATMLIEGENILIQNVQIMNRAGQGEKIGQAVALFAYCHNSKFIDCKIEGFQDTLCTGPLPDRDGEGVNFNVIPLKYYFTYCKQEYVNCYISGTVDFIFGGADADFYHCVLHSRPTLNQENGFITAASTPKGQRQGYTFHHCYIIADPEVKGVYLGRPWRKYAQTTFEDCYLERHILNVGWDDWDNKDNQLTVRYQEIRSKHMSANMRPDWVEYINE